MTYRDVVLEVVNNSTGKKSVSLVLDVMKIMGPVRVDANDLHQAIEKLVQEDEIVELEYTLPSMDYRVKSIYFPKGTVFCQNVKV